MATHHPLGPAQRRAIAAVLLIALVYGLARTGGWAGPGANVQFVPELLYPGMVLITLWGLWRLFRESGGAE